MIAPLNIKDFTYDLPEDRIAKFPLAERENSKLLVFKNEKISDLKFTEAAKLLPENSLLIFNNTRVVQARLLFEKTVGAKPIEIFCLEPHQQDVAQAMAVKNQVVFHCLVGNAKRWNDGLTLHKELHMGDDKIILSTQKIERIGDAFLIQFNWEGDQTFAEILEIAGKVPLPPYLKRQSEESDKTRYQTVYAKNNGSVAAPTAGLHFTPQILDELSARNIAKAETTLHVGAGTFKPVSTDDVREHTMHAEEIHISESFLQTLLAHKNELFCVGTTSARTLESLYWLGVKVHAVIEDDVLKLNQWDAYNLPQNISTQTALEALLRFAQEKNVSQFFTTTQLIIAPGYKFRMIDGLFTNFHQPGSTLILLVAAAVGKNWHEIYNHALQNNYRFLSFGDSSLLFVAPDFKANKR